jgi:hypothetical protein
MGSNELILERSELGRISAHCGTCGGDVVFDALSESAKPPRYCPFCNADFSSVGACFQTYRRFLQEAGSSGHSIQLRVRMKAEK